MQARASGGPRAPAGTLRWRSGGARDTQGDRPAGLEWAGAALEWAEESGNCAAEDAQVSLEHARAARHAPAGVRVSQRGRRGRADRADPFAARRWGAVFHFSTRPPLINHADNCARRPRAIRHLSAGQVEARARRNCPIGGARDKAAASVDLSSSRPRVLASSRPIGRSSSLGPRAPERLRAVPAARSPTTSDA